jgi:hypothetical protein
MGLGAFGLCLDVNCYDLSVSGVGKTIIFGTPIKITPINTALSKSSEAQISIKFDETKSLIALGINDKFVAK